ncbi:hypothetical protein AB0M47_17830 [Hamadaea sp. NPDC051192]|uniref:hypothetical protein n=1 Tax=Hamadaea sp. NPDC051192 TaxID=3154940 RepID=UPI0034141E21
MSFETAEPRQQLGPWGSLLVGLLFVLIGVARIWWSYRVGDRFEHVKPLRIAAKNPGITRFMGGVSIVLGLAVIVIGAVAG